MNPQISKLYRAISLVRNLTVIFAGENLVDMVNNIYIVLSHFQEQHFSELVPLLEGDAVKMSTAL